MSWKLRKSPTVVRCKLRQSIKSEIDPNARIIGTLLNTANTAHKLYAKMLIFKLKKTACNWLEEEQRDYKHYYVM